MTGKLYPSAASKREHDKSSGAKKVVAVDIHGNPIHGPNLSVEERLSSIEDVMKLLLLHAQIVTGEEFTLDDITIERG